MSSATNSGDSPQCPSRSNQSSHPCTWSTGSTRASRVIVILQVTLKYVDFNRQQWKKSGNSTCSPLKNWEGYVCMYVCLYVCMSVCLSVCMYVCMYACLHVCMSVCLYVCMSVCLYVCMSVCLYVCMSVWMHGCMDGWMHACVACMHACRTYVRTYVGT